MARTKKPSTTADLIRSLLVILVPMVVITILFTDLPKDHPVKTVDWQPIVQAARKQAPFPVLAPAQVPAGWQATQASWAKQGVPDERGQRSPRNQWELDFLNAQDAFIGLTQADTDIADLIDQETRQGKADGASEIGGHSWERRISPDGRTRSVLWSQPNVTTIVTGDLPYADLEAYAATLTAG